MYHNKAHSKQSRWGKMLILLKLKMHWDTSTFGIMRPVAVFHESCEIAFWVLYMEDVVLFTWCLEAAVFRRNVSNNIVYIGNRYFFKVWGIIDESNYVEIILVN